MIPEIESKIHLALEQHHLDALVIYGPENLAYATGVVLPYARQYPDRPAIAVVGQGGKTGLVCPLDWAEAAADQGFTGRTLAYGDNDGRQPQASAASLAGLLTELGLDQAALGLDLDNAPVAWVEALTRSLPGLKITPADPILRGLRLIKTPAEVALLEKAAVIADKGIIGALNHLEGTVGSLTYTLAEVAERTRVHAIEHLASGIGHLCVVQGENARLEYAPATGEWVRAGELLRIDTSVHVKGYWACAGRMMVIGQPSVEQAAAYAANQALSRAAVQALRPGAPASSVYQAVAQAASEQGIAWRAEAGAGHGVGLAESEPPYFTPDDATPLQPGMVVAVDVWSYGPKQELIHSVNTCEITAAGSRLLSWYKITGRLYAVTGFRATH